MAENKSKLSFVMEMVDRITGPIEKVTGGTKKAGAAIKNTQTQIEKLNKVSGNIESFQKLQQQSNSTAAALDKQRNHMAELARQMGATENPTKKLSNQFARAQIDTKQLERQHVRETNQLNQMSEKLGKAGIDTSNLSRATQQIARHSQRFTQQLEKQKSALDQVAAREQRLNKLRDKQRDLKIGVAVDTAKITGAVYAISKLDQAYGQIASAQGEIQSLGIGAKGIDEITAAAKKFSDQWAGTTQAQFISASYDIKSGISSLSDEAVAQFTRIAGITAVATKSTTEQMTSLFATGYGIYRDQFNQFGAQTIKGWAQMSAAEKDMQFGQYFSRGIAASVQAFKTDGAQMQQAIERLGASATSANVPFNEQLSILGTLQQTMSGSEAATKYQRFLVGAGKASKKLGLDFLDANNQLRSMPEILDQLHKKFGDTIDANEEQQIKTAFGTDQATQLIKLLYPQVDNLRGSMKSLNGQLSQTGMGLTKNMADVINNGPNESTQILTQRINVMTASLGKAFGPTLMVVKNIIGGFAVGVSDLADRFPILTQILGILIVSLIGIKTAMVAANIAQLAWNTGLLVGAERVTLMNAITNGWAITMKVAAAAQWLVNAAMAANPITWIIVGIMALIAAIVLMIKHWDSVTAVFGKVWDFVVARFQSAVNFMKMLFSKLWEGIKTALSFTPIGLIMKAWGPVVSFFSKMWDRIVGVFKDKFKFITSIFGTVKGWFSSIFGGDDDQAEKVVKVSKQVSSSDSSNPGGTIAPKPAVSVPAPPSVAAAQVTNGSADGGVGITAGPQVVQTAGIAARPNVTQHNESKTEIHINQQPGESNDELIAKMRAELDRRDREQARKNRAALYDGGVNA